MTEVSQIYLGNINNNPDLAELVKIETCLEVYLTESDRAKGRIYTYTNTGLAIGIIKSRDRSLQSGDLFKTESNDLLLVHLQEQKLMVLSFSGLGIDNIPAKLVHLGHILGNHHYPIILQDDKIYVQLITKQEIIEKMIKSLNIYGLKISYEMKAPEQEITFLSHNH